MELNSLKISGNIAAYYIQKRIISIHRNLYGYCEIFIFENTFVLSQTIKLITMFEKLKLLNLINCNVSIIFLKEIK